MLVVTRSVRRVACAKHELTHIQYKGFDYFREQCRRLRKCVYQNVFRQKYLKKNKKLNTIDGRRHSLGDVNNSFTHVSDVNHGRVRPMFVLYSKAYCEQFPVIPIIFCEFDDCLTNDRRFSRQKRLQLSQVTKNE